MTNLTKTQAKKRIAEPVEKLTELQNELDDLTCELQNEAEEIEPYEGKDELTEQQEQRQEWLEETAETMETQTDNLLDIIYELEAIE